jgi:hypothetical protein
VEPVSAQLSRGAGEPAECYLPQARCQRLGEVVGVALEHVRAAVAGDAQHLEGLEPAIEKAACGLVA